MLPQSKNKLCVHFLVSLSTKRVIVRVFVTCTYMSNDSNTTACLFMEDSRSFCHCRVCSSEGFSLYYP